MATRPRPKSKPPESNGQPPKRFLSRRDVLDELAALYNAPQATIALKRDLLRMIGQEQFRMFTDRKAVTFDIGRVISQIPDDELKASLAAEAGDQLTE